MPVAFLLEAPIALAPALAFLFVLDQLDSFRLVSLRAAVGTLIAGGLLAVASYFVNALAMDITGANIQNYARYGAPIIEELLKAAVIIYFFARARIGFLIDAAIMGFAVGTGFAFVENLYYLYTFPEANIGVWIVRGFGTAMMHGGATAIFAVLAQTWTERHTKFQPALYIPGLAAAIVIHSLFNHILSNPLLATGAVLVLIPAILLVTFAKSEHKIHDWLIHDYESHEHLLATMDIEFAHSEAGRFVSEVADKFTGTDAADIFAYMRLHAELVLRAEKVLLGREAGTVERITGDDTHAFRRLHELERKIGRTAMMALWPHLHYSRQELAELYELESRARNRRRQKN
ncbi:MAG: PrsW family glutamic-type intramembrane protease [Alphaproteobacteria bacterium]|nr:PrsW family glutamic-type intramembrane protease [Alphaproteobacteria bacterium]